jgi:hypothetical protein
MVQHYLKQVGKAVISQGKPDGDFATVMTARAHTAIRQIVPANYRLAVRVALKRYAKQLVSGI